MSNIENSMDYWRGMKDGYMKAIKELPNIFKEMQKPIIIVMSEEAKQKLMEEWNNG